MAVHLVAHPTYRTDVMTEDRSVLDRLAADYLASLGSSEPEVERFLFGHLPTAVFDDVFSGRQRIDGPTGRWLLHLSGYFGGRWLRGEIADAQPDAPLVGFSVAPTEESFAPTAERARRRIAAAEGTDEDALAVAFESLLDAPAATPDGAPVPGLADSFGYNAGYNLEILASPPEGLEASPQYDVECTGLLRCDYATSRLPAVAALAPVADAINGGDERFGELAQTLRPLQEAALPRGREVWSTGLSVQGFGQSAYDQLLEVSSAFLETVQATALTMASAHVTEQPSVARTGAVADAGMVVWLASYMSGLLDGETAIELPVIA